MKLNNCRLILHRKLITVRNGSLNTEEGGGSSMIDAWKMTGRSTPGQLCAGTVSLAVVFAVAVSQMAWRSTGEPVPPVLLPVAIVTALVVSIPLVAVFVAAVFAMKRSNEELSLAKEREVRRSGELAVARDALADLNRELEYRVARRTKAMKAALDRAERASTAKSTFLANMSHELRTPLNGIVGYAELVTTRDTLGVGMSPEKIDEYVATILSSGRHLNAMVSDLLDLSRIEFNEYDLNRERVDINDVVRGVVKEMAPVTQARDQRVEVVASRDLPRLDSDYRAIRQIFANLLSNALKYSDAGQTVTVAATVDGRVMRLSVSDRGIGMSQDDLKRATQPFAKFSDAHISTGQSIGLGLSIVKRLCVLLGGSFTLSSAPDAGTDALVTLPLAKTMTTPVGGDTELALAG